MNALNCVGPSGLSSDRRVHEARRYAQRILSVVPLLAALMPGCGGGDDGAYYEIDFTTTLRVANWQEHPVSSFAVRHTSDTEWTVYELAPPLESGERFYLGDVASGQVTFAAESCEGDVWPCVEGETFDLHWSRDYTLQLHDKGVLYLIWKERD